MSLCSDYMDQILYLPTTTVPLFEVGHSNMEPNISNLCAVINVAHVNNPPTLTMVSYHDVLN